MSNADIRELAGGLFLAGVGAAFTAYAGANYPMGSVTRMGPGMVPVTLGVLLAVFGLIIMIGAFFRAREPADIRILVPLFVLGGVLAFALLIKPFGLLPAVAACVVVSTLAELALRPLFSFVLAAAMCLVAWLIFVVALQLPIPLIDWPF